MKPEYLCKLIVTSAIVLSILACSGTFTANFSTPTYPASAETATALPSPIPPTPQLFLTSVPVNEENQDPNYQIKAEVPALQGSTDVNVVNFNTTLANLVNTEINAFKQSVSELPVDTVSPGSSLDVTYTTLLQSGNLWSFKFNFSGYFAGAAHPYLDIITVNYDLAQGRQLGLSDLFLSNSSYLQVISSYCIAELGKREIGFDEVSSKGAAPTPENYDDWNITPDGLLITFDTYQVASGAAGPQTVLIPYQELQAVIEPQGPLAGFAR